MKRFSFANFSFVVFDKRKVAPGYGGGG